MFVTVTIGQGKHQKPTEPYPPLHITVSYVPDQRTILLACFEDLAEKPETCQIISVSKLQFSKFSNEWKKSPFRFHNPWFGGKLHQSRKKTNNCKVILQTKRIVLKKRWKRVAVGKTRDRHVAEWTHNHATVLQVSVKLARMGGVRQSASGSIGFLGHILWHTFSLHHLRSKVPFGS